MSKELIDNPTMRRVLPALIRAGKRARQIAYETGTAVVYEKDGKLIHEYPTEPADIEISEADEQKWRELTRLTSASKPH